MIRRWLYNASIKLRPCLGKLHQHSYRLFLSPVVGLRKLAQLGLSQEGIEVLDAACFASRGYDDELQRLYDKARLNNESPDLALMRKYSQVGDTGLLDQFGAYFISDKVAGSTK